MIAPDIHHMSAIKGASDAANQEHFKLLVLRERTPGETILLCFVDVLALWSPVLSQFDAVRRSVAS
jgi:hypothetical protein